MGAWYTIGLCLGLGLGFGIVLSGLLTVNRVAVGAAVLLAAALGAAVGYLIGDVAEIVAGDVEADDAVVAVAVGQLRDLQRTGRVPHRGQQRADADPAAVRLRAALALAEALVDRLDDLFEGQAGF